MSGATPSPDVEERKLKLEEQKAKVAEDQLKLDSRWVKVWAPLLIPGVLSLAGVIVSIVITHADQSAQTQTGLAIARLQSAVTASIASSQASETKSEDDALNQQKGLEGVRAAAQIYFEKLGDLEKKDTLTAVERSRLARYLTIISILSDNQQFQSIILNEQAEVVRPVTAETLDKNGLQSNAPYQAVQGLPDLVAAVTTGQYSPATFLAFPQVPGTNDPDEGKFVKGLVSLGFKVQPTQHMAAGKSPPDNEIRFYFADQARFARQVADDLKKGTGLTFKPVQLFIPNLPNGVMEFWLGTNSLQHS